MSDDFFSHLESPRMIADDPTQEPAETGRLTSPADISRFMLGGAATLTIESAKTGTRFTYKVSLPRDKETGAIDRLANIRFVSVLTGQSNESDYTYLGYIRDSLYMHGTKKSRISRDAPSAKAFEWFYRMVIMQQTLPDTLKVFHEGKCGRCGRKLTVPESIRSGIGPECIKKGF